MKEFLIQSLWLIPWFLFIQWQITKMNRKLEVRCDLLQKQIDHRGLKKLWECNKMNEQNILAIAELLEASGHLLPVQCGSPECKGSNIIPFKNKDK